MRNSVISPIKYTHKTYNVSLWVKELLGKQGVVIDQSFFFKQLITLICYLMQYTTQLPYLVNVSNKPGTSLYLKKLLKQTNIQALSYFWVQNLRETPKKFRYKNYQLGEQIQKNNNYIFFNPQKQALLHTISNNYQNSSSDTNYFNIKLIEIFSNKSILQKFNTYQIPALTLVQKRLYFIIRAFLLIHLFSKNLNNIKKYFYLKQFLINYYYKSTVTGLPKNFFQKPLIGFSLFKCYIYSYLVEIYSKIKTVKLYTKLLFLLKVLKTIKIIKKNLKILNFTMFSSFIKKRA